VSEECEGTLISAEIKNTLLEYHRTRGFMLYDTFPLVSNDPTVLFTNATITPFKHFFDGDMVPHNYALVQRCLRVGGGAGELETARINPNYSSLFEMFGSGLFGCQHREAVEYFIGMLASVGVSVENLRFVVPDSSPFADALLELNVSRSSIFSIKENGEFWHEWRFGKNGLIGNGLTAVFARNNTDVESADEMVTDNETFVEIGNLVHVYGKVSGNEVLPIPHEGFDVGMGVARLAIILQNKTLYELPPFNGLTEVVATQMTSLTNKSVDSGTLRVIVDHLRSIDALIREGLRPSNKQHAFVLRKLIRSLLEIMWVSAGRIISSTEMISAFARYDTPDNAPLVESVVSEEERTFCKVLEQGRKILAKNPGLDIETLRDTYGIRQSLILLIRE
jgi:alanyl-tRNA synthetase